MAPLEPDPQEWLNLERTELLQRQFANCTSLLRQAGLLRASVGYWVRWQASLDACWPEDEESVFMNTSVEQWLASNKLVESGLSLRELRSKLRVSPAVARWSRDQWSHRLQSLYLQRKSQFDRASCRLLRLKDKNLAMELYHRIKAGESSFDQAAREFGCGPESQSGGVLRMQPLERMPFGLAPLLQRLEVGRLSMPLRLGSGFCLVLLDAFEASQYNRETEEVLLAEQLRLWIDAVVDAVVTGVLLRDQPSDEIPR